jgi:putative phosphoribosyl transferase
VREVRIPGAEIVGDLVLPPAAAGFVVFAHGSGSSRFSSRNRKVAEALQARSLATLLVDLLTPEEEADRSKVFDIDLLADRLIATTQWAQEDATLGGLRLGYFGASTGAGAALTAAARIPDAVAAVVSRGGRPDLAGSRLSEVHAPTLLIVGGRDEVVLDLNRKALEQLGSRAELTVVPDATHLFEETGALSEVSRLAGDWFVAHLAS